MMKINFILLFLVLAVGTCGQSNTAVTSGNIGKCGVWDYPYTLYNTAVASQTVNNGVQVTVDQDRNIGAINLTGTGTMNLSGASGITFSGSGTQISCRWDIPDYGNHTLTNNGGVYSSGPSGIATFFTAPYAGKYVWRANNDWSAAVSGSYLYGTIAFSNSSGTGLDIFHQDEPGTCGISSYGTGTSPVEWKKAILTHMTAGGTLSYATETAYTNDPGCSNTQMTYTIGTAYVTYEN